MASPTSAAEASDPPAARSHDPYAALRLRDFRLYAAGNFAALGGWQMATVAIGWELYERTNSATALGLVGLVQVIPVLLLSLYAGHVVDRSSRRRVILITQLTLAAAGLALAVASLESTRIPSLAPLRACNQFCASLAHRLGETGSRFEDPYVPVMFGLILLNGAARAFNQPARSAFLPQVVPERFFNNAVTWNSSLFEICSMTGPAVGGGLIAMFQTSSARAWAFPAVYGLNAACQLGQFIALYPVRPLNPPRPKEPMTLHSLSAGVRYVWQTKIILATLTLDLFAVILGGAVTLLPIYARDILHVGPGGLGWLRAAPSVGAVSTAILLAHRPPMRRAGRNLLWGVVGFGVATVAFGFSRNFWLSMLMLALTGTFDNISVVIRSTLVQVLTPDAMRGRVSAVNGIFIGSSNQLGGLESGLTAAAFGATASVVIGGLGTILVVGAAALIWPQVRRLGRLDPEGAALAEAEVGVQGFPVATVATDAPA